MFIDVDSHLAATARLPSYSISSGLIYNTVNSNCSITIYRLTCNKQKVSKFVLGLNLNRHFIGKNRPVFPLGDDDL